MSNPHRGEARLAIGGADFLLRPSFTALVAAEELQQRGADFEARQAAAWQELDRQRTQIAALESIRLEPLDDLHVRAAELETARNELERQSQALQSFVAENQLKETAHEGVVVAKRRQRRDQLSCRG